MMDGYCTVINWRANLVAFPSVASRVVAALCESSGRAAVSPFSSSSPSFPSRPLPLPASSTPGPVKPLGGPHHDNVYSIPTPDTNPLSRPPYTSLPVEDERPAATLRGGTLLPEGLYDLLAQIPTSSPFDSSGARLLVPPLDVVAGPRYEDLPDSNQVAPIKLALTSVSLSAGPVSPKKGRRISKDMVSKPMVRSPPQL